MKIRFEWDETKARSNLRKHRVSFEIAARVFADPFAMVKQDRIENGISLANFRACGWLFTAARSAYCP